MIKGIIFDLDGTLADTIKDLRTAVNAMLTKLGYPNRSLSDVTKFINNGARELNMVDSDGDGKSDTFIVDVNGDGNAELEMIDANGDGEFDYYDFHARNAVEAISDLISGDFAEPSFADVPDDSADPFDPDSYDVSDNVFDLDGDGCGETTAYDTDGDGSFDLAFVDGDRDGYNESILTDSDRDGIFDVAGFDYNGDGRPDEIKPIDYSEVESADSKETEFNDFTGSEIGSKEYIDSDGDGRYDTYIHRYSGNDDGFFDSSEEFLDTDADGEVDSVIKTVVVDTNGDGDYDEYTQYFDEDGDGVFDAVRVYDYDSENGIGDLVHFDDDIDIESDIYTTEAEYYNAYEQPTFTPGSVDEDAVVGNPGESMEHWEYQGDTNRCAVYAQKFIIEQYTGQEIDVEELAHTAAENGWFSETNGTSINSANKLLDMYGVPNEVSYNNSLDDLRSALDSGKMIIVGVDADEYWGQDTDDVFSPADGTNHAVQVIGIDESDPENPMVILNDSGSPRGCGEMVPADVFIDAWDDGNNLMIAAG